MSGSVPGSFEPDHDTLVAQFMNAHGVDVEEANIWLSSALWNINAASEAYQSNLADAEAESSGAGSSDSSEHPAQSSGGPSSSSQSRPPQQQKKFATLGDLGSSQAPAEDDEDDEDDQDFFAGGEKSGLAVQNPDDLKRKILEKARRNAARPGGDETTPPTTNFRGTARTLGGDDEPSRVIEDPRTTLPQRPERVQRRLHFWTNGFSVDDGELYDTAEPRNAQILNMIRSGRAPLDIMNVAEDQEVDVKVEQHEGPYVAPKKQFKPFSGQGQRLGSPTPGGLSADTPPPIAQPAPVAAPVSGSGDSASQVQVDSSQPAVSIQIRLGDGTRLVSRFNTTHTIEDLYSFVNASNPGSASRQYALMTTFPSKELSDHNATIGDTPELKKGGSIVQKWL